MSRSLPVRTAVAASLTALAALALPLAPADAAATPQCTNADLQAGYRHTDDATSHRFGRIVLRNVSDHACHTRGFGGLSYVGHGDGTQIGAAAERDHTTPVRTVVLQPGERVRSAVSETVASAYPRKRCHPRPVDGFRVYVPDSTVSQFVAHATTGCAKTGVHLIVHRAYR